MTAPIPLSPRAFRIAGMRELVTASNGNRACGSPASPRPWPKRRQIFLPLLAHHLPLAFYTRAHPELLFWMRKAFFIPTSAVSLLRPPLSCACSTSCSARSFPLVRHNHPLDPIPLSRPPAGHLLCPAFSLARRPSSLPRTALALYPHHRRALPFSGSKSRPAPTAPPRRFGGRPAVP
jgi:hypothetical protein